MERGHTEGSGTPGFLARGGEMGAAIRALDWSRTPIGPLESWPPELRTAVDICLSSRFPILIWWGPELVKIYNDDYSAILGRKHPEALGRAGREVWPEIWDIIGPMLEGVLERGEATWSDDQLLAVLRRGYEEEAYFTFSYSPIHDAAGAVRGVFCAVHETTERVLGERRLRTLGTLAELTSAVRTPDEAVGQAMAALEANRDDVPFAVLYARDADVRGETTGADLLGATSLASGAPAPPARIDAGDTRAPWPVVAALERDEPVVAWAAPGADDGGSGRPEALVLPVTLPTDSFPTGALVLGVNPRRTLDGDYRDFFRLVARDVATAIANATAYEEERVRADALVALDLAKTEFFGNISHEFRTPLTLMLGPLEDLLRDGAVDGERREQVEVSHRNAERLLRLVNTLLDFSRLEAGRAAATLGAADVGEIAADLASTFRGAAERAGLRLTVDTPATGATVLVDRELFERALLNLLSNALKFTFEGEIRVTVRVQDGTAVIEVADTGEGIAPEDLPRLFERFRRVRGGRARSHEGSGIGLALVEQVAILHGGRVSVESQPGIGSTFRLTLPLTDEKPASAPRGGAPSARVAGYADEAMRWVTAGDAAVPRGGRPGDRPRVLFADDNEDMRDYVGRLLGARFDVRIVTNGRQALELLRAEGADLVLADVMMPGLDGFGLLEAVREDERLRRTPFVMLSARAGEEAAVEGLRAGADDYVVKPFAAEELLARVRSNLELGRMRNRLAELDREEAHRLRGLYDREHRIAESLQRSLLPERLPTVPFLDLTGSYVPAEQAVRVGGDWYDALALVDGSVLLVIGDVAGQGLPAASVMGELRSAARAYALEGHSPAQLLRRMDSLMRTTERTFMATCLCVRLEPSTGTLTYASAGHPPAVLRHPDGTTEQLTGALAAPLGFLSARRGPEATVHLAPGAVVAMYTDGLVERRGRSIDEGIDRLAAALSAGDGPADTASERLLAALGADEGLDDDVALLVARTVPVDARRLELSLGAVPASLAPLRRALTRWLEANDVGPKVAYDIVLAVNESATNAIEHAYGPGTATFDFTASREGDAVELVVCDSGHWRPARGEHRGRGLGVMRATMDSVDVERGTTGSKIRLRRVVERPTAGAA
jgi:signal transduction histidine kinase/serine phosphatase RsbU (regulator of sigma subunit)